MVDVDAVSDSLGARALLALVAFAFLLRLLAALALGVEDRPTRGYVYYIEMADHVRAGEGFHRRLPFGHGERHAIRTPLYPLCLAGFESLPTPLGWTVVLFGAVCGSLTVLFTALLAADLYRPSVGLLSGLLVATWPLSVVHDTALQDSALYSMLFLLAVWLARRLAYSRWGLGGRGPALAALLGFLAATAVLTRVALWPTLVLLAVWLASDPARRGLAGSVKLAALMLACFGLGLAPWVARNVQVVGAPVLTTDVGRSMWLGNNPETFSVYPEQSIDRAEERAWTALSKETQASARALGDDELASDAWFRQRAESYMLENPGTTLVGIVRKAWATFGPWYSPRGSWAKQLVHALSYTPIALLALVALFRQRRRWWELAPFVFAPALLALQSGLFFGHSAYRVYVDPLLIVLAASLLATGSLDSRLRSILPGREGP